MDNVITLQRVVKDASGHRYEATEPDYILNQASSQNPAAYISERVTELMKKEYYLTLPAKITIAGIPKTKGTKNTVITEDVTVRVNTPDYFKNYYLTYAYGSVTLLSKEAGKAIALADEGTGSVIDSKGRVCWSRGVKSSSAEIEKLAKIERSGGDINELMACVKMLLTYRNIEADVTTYQSENELLTDWLERYLKLDIMKLTGVSLDEALFYVYRSNPVIAVNEQGDAILITAYDSTGITAAVPATGKRKRYSEKEAKSFLGEENYYFIVVGGAL